MSKPPSSRALALGAVAVLLAGLAYWLAPGERATATDRGGALLPGAAQTDANPELSPEAGRAARPEETGSREVLAPQTSTTSVALGPLPVVRGVVRAREGGAVAGAEVRCVASIGSVDRALAGAISDASGAFEFVDLPLDVLTPGERPAASFSVAVTAEGFLPTRTQGKFLEHGEPVLDFGDVVLDTGALVRGRCVDRIGEPVRGAAVYLLTPDISVFTGHLTPAEDDLDIVWEHARDVTDHEGRFALALPDSGPAVLLARHGSHGATRRELGDVTDGPRVREFGDIVLTGAGSLSGRVLHTDGTPATAFEVCAVPAELVGDRGAWSTIQNRLHAEEGVRGDGLLAARTWTAADGAFELVGLFPGRYALFHPGARTAARDPWPIFDTDREGIVLRAPHPRLVVRVLVDGHPAPAARVRLHALEDAQGSRAQFPTQQGETDIDGFTSFDLAPQANVAVHVTLPGRALTEVAVQLASGESERRIDVELFPAAPPARLLARLIDPRDGSSIPAVAELRSRATDVVITRLRTFGEHEVEPGSYSLELRPSVAALPGDERFDLPDPVRRDIELEAGQRTELDLPAALGGRLRIVLISPPPPLGPNLTPPANADEAELGRWRRTTISEAGVRATISSPDGSRTLLFPGPRADTVTRILPDPAGHLTTTVLPAGPYTLELTAPPFQDARTAVTVRSGEVTEVRVELAPR